MIGRDRRTGLPLSGFAHAMQSIEDILTTKIGSRRMLPEYGSTLKDYVDLPVNDGWKGAVAAEVIRAVGRWEKRVRLSQVTVISMVGGQITLRLQGEYLGDTPEALDQKVTV
jgi:phage baseplate assembly protein W